MSPSLSTEQVLSPVEAPSPARIAARSFRVLLTPLTYILLATLLLQ